MAKILVVDDERMICDLLHAVLGRHGHEVYVTTNPREATQMYRLHQPAIMLLDLNMPVMDGIAVLTQIRLINPNANIIMLTGEGTDARENQARERGVTDFLRKGLSLNVLMDVMNRAMHRPALQCLTDRPIQGKVSEESNGPQILVVDDEELIRDLLSQFLTQRGYRVRLASNGIEALVLVATESPRLIILDMYMPEMNGAEVFRELKAKQFQGGVVALTASQDEKLLQQILDLGSVDVLGKPVDLDRLDLVVQVGLALTELESN